MNEVSRGFVQTTEVGEMRHSRLLAEAKRVRLRHQLRQREQGSQFEGAAHEAAAQPAGLGWIKKLVAPLAWQRALRLVTRLITKKQAEQPVPTETA